jgi:hypothetical protein
MAGVRPGHVRLRASGTVWAAPPYAPVNWENAGMNRIIYIVGLIVVVMAVLWFFGLR